MPGLIGGRWRSGCHGEPEGCTHRETGGIEPGRLPLPTSQRPTSQGGSFETEWAEKLARSARDALAECGRPPTIRPSQPKPKRGVVQA
jgi:hypothetical protein